MSEAFIFPLKKGRQDSLRKTEASPAKSARGILHKLGKRSSGSAPSRGLGLKVLEWRKVKGSGKQRTMEEKIMGFTWYSVRHVSIKRMLIESKYPIHYVAEKANTGITMITDFYFKYMEEPEGRIVSRHPAVSDDKREIQVFDEETLKSLETLDKTND